MARHDGAQQPHRHGNGEGLAKALGWFSIGLGLAQLTAPRRMARLVGVAHPDAISQGTMRAVGLREIAAGVGLLAQSRPVPWAWGRVAGDAMDLALLGRAFTSNDSGRDRTTAATLAVLGITALDVFCAATLSRGGATDAAAPDGASAQPASASGDAAP